MLFILAQTTQPALDAFDLLNRIDQFYQNAWTRLLILLGIVGVVVPYWLQRNQRLSFDKSEASLRADIAEATRTMSSRIETEVTKAKSEMDDKVKILQRDIALNSAELWGLEAMKHGTTATAGLAYVVEACALLEGGETLQARVGGSLDNAIGIFEGADLAEITRERCDRTLSALETLLRRYGLDGEHAERMTKIKRLLLPQGAD